MRVALLTPYLPCPANTGGRIRMYRLARALARRASVSLYACAGVREAALQRAREELALYEAVRVRNSDWGAVAPLVNSRRVRRSCPALLARDLARDHARARYDVLVVEHSYAAATARGAPGVPWVLDEHNVESRYQREYFAAEGRADFRARREVALLEAWERRAWAGATALTCVSGADASAIAPHRADAPCVIPNGVQLADVPLVLPSERAGAEVLFVGLLSHAPNVQAALFLAREVMPALWREEPAARLVLCGRTPAREVLALAGPRVEVTGTVPSVAPYLSRAAVYANALFRGAGSSLKVPEALASGLPLVSTGVGVRGFELREGEHYARAEDAEGFARALLAALRGRAGLDARALRARAVAEGFDWERLGERFADVVFRAAEAR